MGMNIYLREWERYQDHPEWDSDRISGDGEFPNFCKDLPKIYNTRCKEMFDDMDAFRPADFKLWRLAIRKSKLPFRARFLKLMTLCEQNPDYWISFSY